MSDTFSFFLPQLSENKHHSLESSLISDDPLNYLSNLELVPNKSLTPNTTTACNKNKLELLPRSSHS